MHVLVANGVQHEGDKTRNYKLVVERAYCIEEKLNRASLILIHFSCQTLGQAIIAGEAGEAAVCDESRC